jgi:CubicO group peptidase (beta-lactamase class C family)
MFKIISFISILVSTFFAGFNSSAQQSTVYFPTRNEWLKKPASSAGFNKTLLDSAISFAIAHTSTASTNLKEAHYQSSFGREPFGFLLGPMKTRGPGTGIIIKNGFIIAEWGEPSRVDFTFSVAKSFLSVLTGITADSGMIEPDDFVYKSMAPIIPAYNNVPDLNMAEQLGKEDVFELFATPHNRKITWDHLLRQASDWEGTLWGKPDWADRPSADAKEWLNRKKNEPGTVYEYNDTRVNVLALALLNIWRKPLPVVLKEKLMDPIDASATWRWLGYHNSWVIIDGQQIQSVSGGSHWGGGLMINAYDQARFGYLSLRNGKWKNKQIVSADWLKKSRTAGPANKAYGYMNFFLNEDRKMIPAAPATAFMHVGAGSNIIYVDPQNDLVVVARWIDYDAVPAFIQAVLAAAGK